MSAICGGIDAIDVSFDSQDLAHEYGSKDTKVLVSRSIAVQRLVSMLCMHMMHRRIVPRLNITSTAYQETTTVRSLLRGRLVQLLDLFQRARFSSACRPQRS